MITNIGTHLKVKNFQESTAFYEALGFKKIFEYGPNKPVKEKYQGVTYEHQGTKLELADGHVAVKPATFQEEVLSAKISLMIQVDSITEIMRICKKHTIPLTVGPRHYYWGTLEIVIKDPDGVILVFICPYSPQEAKKIKADEQFATQPDITS